VIVVRSFNLHQTLPVWFLQRKILRRSRPKFVLDIRTLPVDIQSNFSGTLRKLRFESSVRLAFRYFDGISLITEKMKCDLQRKADNYEQKLCVWSSGVDPILFNPDTVVNIKNDLKYDQRFVIMYHGFLSPNRGLQQSVEAIAMLRIKYPEIMLFLLGKGSVEIELEKQIRNLSLQNHVFIHPPVAYEDVPKYIKMAQVGILPFPDLNWWNTSSPIKLLEYLAMKKPVIVTDIAAHRAVLSNEKCAFYIPNHQPDSVAHGIMKVLKKENELAILGESARKLAIHNHTWEKQASKIKAFFQAL
jgi:glycosyltransferase involved in cell wall biosynthesis